MMVRRIIVIIFLCFALNTSFSQASLDCNNFNNRSIDYHIILHTKMTRSDTTSGYYVRMDLSKKQKKCLLNKDSTFWLSKFNNDSTDLAAEILLYYINRREASTIFLIKRKVIVWSDIKSNEIKYWIKFFRRRM
jgi:hypothetical protein